MRDWALWALGNIPGFPPIIQSIHLLSICAIVASAVFLNLRVIGVAARAQSVTEMSHRLRYWAFGGLLGAFCSGIFFILARPTRYFDNPVFHIKFIALLVAVILSAIVFSIAAKREEKPLAGMAKIIAFVSLCAWILVILAGRWIAYSEYLFWRDY